MTISEDFLQLVRCPVTRSPLTAADASLVALANRAIQEKRLLNRTGQAVEQLLDEGLINGDRSLLYAVRDSIASLIADEAMPLDQLESTAPERDVS